MSGPDFFNEVVRRKHNKPENWCWAKLNAHNMPEDFVEVSGSVTCGVITRGPRKGHPKWSLPLEVVFVRMAEVRAAEKQFEAATGCCSGCAGAGKYKSGKECFRCGGNGKPKGGAA